MELLIKEISKLELKAGDIVVFKSDFISPENLAPLKEYFAKLYGPERIGIMVVPDGVEVGKLTVEPKYLKVKKVFESAKVPFKGSKSAAGWDLFIPEDFEPTEIRPEESLVIDLGIAVAIPEGKFGMIRPRSSAFKKGILAEGVIDSDFSGSLKLMLVNMGNTAFPILPGKAYAQMILVDHAPETVLELVEELPKTERGENGLGSTGNH